MPTTAGVGPHAQQIQGVFGPTISIQNLGPGSVYLGSDSSVTKDNGWRLPENAMGTWTGGSQLWACSDGATAELRIADSSLAFFTPGPDHVTIDGGTVTIGNASIPISGSVDIASGTVDAVINGPVAISGGQINVGGTVTALNNAVTLRNDQTTVYNATGTGVTLYDSFATDLSQFATMIFSLGNVNVGGVDTGSGVLVSVQQLTLSGDVIKEERPRYMNSGYMRYTTEIVAPRVRLTAYRMSVNQPVVGVMVAATSAVMPHSYYQFPGNASQGINFATYFPQDNSLSKQVTLTATQPAGNVVCTWFFPSWAGSAHYMWYIGNVSTQSSTFILFDALSGDQIRWSNPVNLSNTVRSDADIMLLPETPLMIQVTNRESGTPAGRAIGAAFVFS